jgi:hypothetical protein
MTAGEIGHRSGTGVVVGVGVNVGVGAMRVGVGVALEATEGTISGTGADLPRPKSRAITASVTPMLAVTILDR